MQRSEDSIGVSGSPSGCRGNEIVKGMGGWGARLGQGAQHREDVVALILLKHHEGGI